MTSDNVRITGEDLSSFVSAIFEAAGVDQRVARTVAASLVDADLEGVTSHGVMLVPMYVERIRAGSVDPGASPRTAVDSGAIAVLDAQNGLGQVSGDQAIGLAVTKAKQFGIGAVAVRQAFHFGMARRYALAAAEAGCVGIVSCNTRPLMPAPGGAERLVGNNPIAIALPVGDDIPLVLDIALSEAAMGKIRMAEQTGHPIPKTWATNAAGEPTTDPAEAISGMLLPAGAHKGFGLAFMLDLLSGLLSGGAWGEGVQPLYGDPATAYNSSHLFIAIDVGHFRPASDFKAEAREAAERVRNSTPARGTERMYSPGEPEWERRKKSGEWVQVAAEVFTGLSSLANELGVDAPAVADSQTSKGDSDA
jgi:LDH2 family malate/lactate/ureidoglycolate dehydrogenase